MKTSNVKKFSLNPANILTRDEKRKIVGGDKQPCYYTCYNGCYWGCDPGEEGFDCITYCDNFCTSECGA
jgi:hypothetical protein